MNRVTAVFVALLGCFLAVAGAAGQDLPGGAGSVALSLGEALGRALGDSEEVRLARARAEMAEAQVGVARSAALPQINTQLSYTKTLRSVFQSAGGGFDLPDSLRFEPDPTAPLEERVEYLEDRVPSAALGALGSLFSDLPFGNENAWLAAVSVSQPLFTGGRISSSIRMAAEGAEAARAGLDEARSDVALEVKRAYYDAVLAARMEEIVGQSVALAEDHLDQVRLRLDAGRASELEALRAEVELENLRPLLIEARTGRDLAVLELKRLVNLPAEVQVTLTTELDATTSAGGQLAAFELPAVEVADRLLAQRAAVRAAESQVQVREEQVDVARSAYLPNLAFTGNFARQAFPTQFSFPSGGEWRDDWTVGLAVQWPLFQGLRRSAEVEAAKAQVSESRLQLAQLQEGVRLEYRQAGSELERAQARIGAAARTAEQAARVYELTELRFEEGLATQLDVSDARLALQQARMNQVQAYHAAYTALAAAERALGLPLEESTLP